MARRFFATAVFGLVLWAALAGAPVRGNDFTDHFTFAKPPLALPMFTFQDAKGQVFDVSNFRGHYLLLNVWATWCGPCTSEMPALDKLAGQFASENTKPSNVKDIAWRTADSSPFKTKLDIVAIAEDHDGPIVAESFYRRHNLHNLKVYVDDSGEIPSILKIPGLPTTFFIDPTGHEIGRIEGATDWDDPATFAFLKAQMKPTAK